MTRAGVPAPLLFLLCAVAPARAGDALDEVRAAWPKLDRDGKVAALMRLSGQPSPRVLRQCALWAADDDLLVRGQVIRLAALHFEVPACRAGTRDFLAAQTKAYLDARRLKEEREFDEVCRKYGRAIPPADQMTAGRDWQDPWDEERRELPAEVRQERQFANELVDALAALPAVDAFPSLQRLFVEHHDPEVLVRVVGAFGALGDWRALPDLADLARIQRYGREIGGSVVIGQKAWDTMRLKWDVHKDRLWWSRPEYVPRVVAPALAAAERLTGTRFRDVAALDAWLLAHEELLRGHGVKLTPEFRARARPPAR